MLNPAVVVKQIEQRDAMLAELRSILSDVAVMPIGCDCINCYKLRRKLAARAMKALDPASTGGSDASA